MPVSTTQTNHFAGILLTIFLAASHERIGRSGSFWPILFALPGTVLHELAHFLVALVTGGKPRGFSIVPRRRSCTAADGSSRKLWVLGSVTLGNAGIFSAVPTALAPLGLIVVAWYLYRHWFSWFPGDTLHTLLLYATVYIFCYSSIPSSTDLKVAFSHLPSLLFYGCLLCGIFYFCAV